LGRIFDDAIEHQRRSLEPAERRGHAHPEDPGVRNCRLPPLSNRLEFIINLKTAKALGLTIPPSLLLRADQVIE
jgi:hypothetical protein